MRIEIYNIVFTFHILSNFVPEIVETLLVSEHILKTTYYGYVSYSIQINARATSIISNPRCAPTRRTANNVGLTTTDWRGRGSPELQQVDSDDRNDRNGRTRSFPATRKRNILHKVCSVQHLDLANYTARRWPDR